jgi:hypothetical protein
MKRKAKQAKETGTDDSAILRAIIAEAVELDREISAKQERLKDCKRYLAEVAAGRPGEHLPTGNGGRSWRMEGESGCAVNVAFPAPILRARLEGDLLAACRKLAGKLAGKLFSPIDAMKPAPDFRAAALASLGSSKGAKLVALCESPAAPRVSFETKTARNPA